MNDKKQIEEIAKDVWKASCAGHGIECTKCEYANNSTDEYSCVHFVISQNLYNASYRKQKWISVDEKLPEDGQLVLTIDTDGEMQVCFYEVDREGVFQQFHGLVKIYNITHWMSLPEPPKMRGGE